MTVEEDVNKRISVRPTKELAEAVKTYMGIHKCTKTEAIERIFQEWQELTQKTQTEPSTPQQTTKDNLPENLRTMPLNNPVVEAYLKTKSRCQASLETFKEKEAILTQEIFNREKIRVEAHREKAKTVLETAQLIKTQMRPQLTSNDDKLAQGLASGKLKRWCPIDQRGADLNDLPCIQHSLTACRYSECFEATRKAAGEATTSKNLYV